jgi:Helix-turn-helix
MPLQVRYLHRCKPSFENMGRYGPPVTGLILTNWQEGLSRALGARVKEIRLAEGLSQEELSFKAEVDQSRLSKLERLGPAAIGWKGFCRVVAAMGFELSFTIKKSSGRVLN